MHKLIDKIGATASFLCAIHCLCVPFLLIALPYSAIFWLVDEKFELTFTIISCTIALLSICAGHSKHGKSHVLFILAIGVLFIVMAHHSFHGHEPLLMFIGGLFLCVAHVINIKLCNQCHQCGETNGCNS